MPGRQTGAVAAERTADAETSAAHPRQHRVTGYAALETKRPWKSGSFGNFHQQPLGLGVLDAVHQLAAFVHVTNGLGQGDAGLDEHDDAHREIALDPEIERQEEHADGDHEGRSGKRNVGEGNPGTAVGLDVLVHDNLLFDMGLIDQVQFQAACVRLAFNRASTSSAVDFSRGPKPCSASFSAVASGPLAASSSIKASAAAWASIWRSRRRFSVFSASGSVDS